MGVLNATARSCLQDCLSASKHLVEANDQRFLKKKDAVIYQSVLFTTHVASASRAIARAKEALDELDAPAHSRNMRQCHHAYEGCEKALTMLEERANKRDIYGLASKLQRYCQRALE